MLVGGIYACQGLDLNMQGMCFTFTLSFAHGLEFYFIFAFGITAGSSLTLLLVLCSGTISDHAWGTIWGAED